MRHSAEEAVQVLVDPCSFLLALGVINMECLMDALKDADEDA
jgi:hypothetical protein